MSELDSLAHRAPYQRLVILRLDKGWREGRTITADEVARAVGLSEGRTVKSARKMISYLENDRMELTPQLAQRFADYYGVSVRVILGQEALPPPYASALYQAAARLEQQAAALRQARLDTAQQLEEQARWLREAAGEEEEPTTVARRRPQ
jgi:transcriptional regulator with XRE-family HTH domain